MRYVHNGTVDRVAQGAHPGDVLFMTLKSGQESVSASLEDGWMCPVLYFKRS